MALRLSMFDRVPPFINYIPAPIGTIDESPPQYWDQERWDQDHLWHVPICMANYVSFWAKEDQLAREYARVDAEDQRGHQTAFINGSMVEFRAKPRGARRSLALSNDLALDPFVERPDDAINFIQDHNDAKLVIFPKMHQLARKDQLADCLAQWQKRFPKGEFSFHPVTFVLPRDRQALNTTLLKASKRRLWVVKPPNGNNGHGVRIIDGDEKSPCLNLRTTAKSDITKLPPKNNKAWCVQEYIEKPLLIRGSKFDLRVYVLLTSLDPLTVYIYQDGLVRIATEPFSENPRSASNSCAHITNFAVNKLNEGRFVHCDGVDGTEGHKWRLKSLWPYLSEMGVKQHEFTRIWAQVEDVVIKSLLASYAVSQAEYRLLAMKKTVYNAYKLLGYDLMLDQNFTVHLIEVNARPALLHDQLDRAVNRPMMAEMFRIVGYHLPPSVAPHRDFLVRHFGLTHKLRHATFQSKLYSRHLLEEEERKHESFSESDLREESYFDKILDDLLPCDVRTLIKLEEELSQLRMFSRVFPTSESHTYFRFLSHLSYYDKLADAYERTYHQDRKKGIERLNGRCLKDVHL